MSESLTHTRGAESPLNLITGEPPGIKEILERRAAEGNPPDPGEQREPEQRQDDDAERAAREIAQLNRRATDAENRAEQERQGRITAERERAAAVQGAEETGLTAINTALASATREKDALTAEMKTAGESGDFGRVAEISARLGELGADIREFQAGQRQFEQDRQRRIETPPERQAPANVIPHIGTSRDAYMAGKTDATQAWLREHPEFFNDASAFRRIAGAHEIAVGRNLIPDTPEYFRFVEDTALSQSNTPRREATERSTPPGTPPSRDAPGPTGRPRIAAGDVYVTQEQKAAAAWMGVDPADYAQQEAELKSRGELPYRRR